MENQKFWETVDRLITESEIIIDRPRGSRHPKYPGFVYPLDYGCLSGTASMDGGGIDVWRGSASGKGCEAVVCTVDLLKKDSEIKILIDCTEEEINIVMSSHNNKYMSGILIRR